MLKNVLSNWLGLLISGIVSFTLALVLIHELGSFYDSRKAIITHGKDPSGYPVSGESAYDGELLSAARGANVKLLWTLSEELAPGTKDQKGQVPR